MNTVPDIKRSFCNAIEEAIRNAGSSVEIDVSEATADGKKIFATAIVDDGPGIPENVKQMLFTRFEHDSPVPPGKYLGFYTGKVLVETSGGTIEVGDRVPGNHAKGTRVVITLPAASAEEGQ